MNKKQKALVGFLSLLLVAIIGCSAMQNVITPAYIDEDAIAYSGDKSTMFTPYTSLWDLQRIERGVHYMHYKTQIDYTRMAEDDTINYDFLTKGMAISMQSAQELRDNIFSPTGPIGMLLAAGPALGIGLMLSKPGDKKKIVELETKLNGNK